MNKLTENLIKKAEILEKQYKIYDGDGMFLLVHPNGSKYWRMKYRFNGKHKLASFGVWPAISLKEARERRAAAKQQIKSGINPVEEKRKIKDLQHTGTSTNVNKEFMKFGKSKKKAFQWSSFITNQRSILNTNELIQSLRLFIFGKVGMKSLFSLSKEEMKEILFKIINNRGEFFNIIWSFYLRLPIFNIAILFILLVIVMGFLSAVFTTALYLILSVLFAIAISIWEENNSLD